MKIRCDKSAHGRAGTGRILRLCAVVAALLAALPLQAFAQQTKINPKDGAVMIFIPAGEFIMGSAEGEAGDADEKPQRKVYLDGYWIYKYPVTVGQYKRYCAATGRQMPKTPSWGWIDNHPVVNVSWEDAADYCRWAGVRFPTEAQWEKAARGTDGRIYPFGSDEWDLGNNANYGNKIGRTTPVNQYPGGASPYGVMDMAGNVWEWCMDWYGKDYYQDAPAKNPRGPVSGQYRVLRGGGWNNYSFYCRAAGRTYVTPSIRNNFNFGFRCVSPGR